MRHALIKYAAVAALSFRQRIEERAALWGRVMFYFIILLTYSRLWQAVLGTEAAASIMQRFGHVRGWRLEDVMCLYAVSTGGYGLTVITFGGIHELSRKVEDGELDTFMTQPKSVLFQALASRTHTSGWGDVVASIGLFSLSGMARWSTLPWMALAVLCATVTFTACGVIHHSLAFWFTRIHTLSRGLWDFTLNFSVDPPALFEGGLEVVLFTLLPAGLVSYLPVEMLRHPTPLGVFSALGGTGLYAAFALWFFGRGLRHYASGNRFSPRA